MRRLILARHPMLTVLFLVLGLIGAEIALQTRAELATGRSVFSAMFAEPTKVFDPELGFDVFRPNAEIGGGRQTIETNAQGFRSPQLADDKRPGVRRVAFVGASTVFGAYTPRNRALMSYQVAEALRGAIGARRVELFNAGLPGLGLTAQLRVLEQRVLPWRPDVVVFYTGMNDVGAVCRDGAALEAEATGAKNTFQVPVPSLPNWLLSFELIRKNTLFMRPKPEAAGAGPRVTSSDVPFERLRAQVEALLEATRQAGAAPVVATLARAFHPAQPPAQQERLSASMRYYHDCFDLPALNANADGFNAMLRAAAANWTAPVVDLAREIPPGSAHFADATHFSIKGETRAAENISATVRDLLEPAPRSTPIAQE